MFHTDHVTLIYHNFQFSLKNTSVTNMADSPQSANMIKKKSLFQKKPVRSKQPKIKLTLNKRDHKRTFSEFSESDHKITGDNHNEPPNKKVKRSINNGKKEEDEERKDDDQTNKKDKKEGSEERKKKYDAHHMHTALQDYFKYTRGLETENKRLRGNTSKLINENKALRRAGLRVVEERNQLQSQIRSIKQRIREFTDLVETNDKETDHKEQENELRGMQVNQDNVVVNDDTTNNAETVSKEKEACPNQPTVKKEDGTSTSVAKTVLVRDGLELLGYKLDADGVMDLMSSESENDNS
eukprot:69132_1